MITLSVDVTRLDKSRFKHLTRKDGSNAIFVDLVCFPGKNGPDQFGNDGIVKQQVTKEEREARVEMPILGNFRNIAPRPLPAIDAHNAAKANAYQPQPQSDDPLPF